MYKSVVFVWGIIRLLLFLWNFDFAVSSITYAYNVPYISLTLSNTKNYLHDVCRYSTSGDIAVNQNTAELSTVYSRTKLHINHSMQQCVLVNFVVKLSSDRLLLKSFLCCVDCALFQLEYKWSYTSLIAINIFFTRVGHNLLSIYHFSRRGKSR